MQKEIKFGGNSALLEREGCACAIVTTPELKDISRLADAVDKNDGMEVLSIFPPLGKIIVYVEKSTTNSILTEAVCDAISEVYNIDTRISNA